MKTLLILVCMFFTSGVYAGCVTTARGRTICDTAPAAVVVNPSSTAVVVNPNTGNAVKAQTNYSTGVTHTETSRGGEAYTKNGRGVAQGPGGKTCVKTRNNQGCN